MNEKYEVKKAPNGLSDYWVQQGDKFVADCGDDKNARSRAEHVAKALNKYGKDVPFE